MVDIERLRLIVARGLKDYLKCPVIKSNQNADPPNFPYVSYTITTVASENNGTYQEHEDGIARKGVNTVWSITALSDNNAESVKLAQKARDWLGLVGTTYLNDNGVIVQAVTSVTNRDNIFSSEYEYRNGFDCFFWGYDAVEMPNVESIETVEIDGKEIVPEHDQDIIADLNRKLDEANANFENIRLAIVEKGIDVPYDTDTSEYGNLVREAISNAKSVHNADTHYDFPSVGETDVIYKAQSEKLIYQWNPTELKYEVLGASAEIDISSIETINGGNAHG